LFILENGLKNRFLFFCSMEDNEGRDTIDAFIHAHIGVRNTGALEVEPFPKIDILADLTAGQVYIVDHTGIRVNITHTIIIILPHTGIRHILDGHQELVGVDKEFHSPHQRQDIVHIA